MVRRRRTRRAFVANVAVSYKATPYPIPLLTPMPYPMPRSDKLEVVICVLRLCPALQVAKCIIKAIMLRDETSELRGSLPEAGRKEKRRRRIVRSWRKRKTRGRELRWVEMNKSRQHQRRQAKCACPPCGYGNMENGRYISERAITYLFSYTYTLPKHADLKTIQRRLVSI